jgi:hypothetical protein
MLIEKVSTGILNLAADFGDGLGSAILPFMTFEDFRAGL